jgi:hypothetical protein
MIDLTNEIVPWKIHIRKLVEASTIYYKNSYDLRFRAVDIFRKSPVKEPGNSFNWLLLFASFILGISVTVYAVLLF